MNQSAKNKQEISKSKIEELSNYVLLVLFGVAYNELIERLEDTTDSDMLTSLTVAFGVGMTLLLSVPILGRRVVAKFLFSFIASGSPMILGHLSRWQKRGSVLSADSAEKRTRSRR